MFTVYRRIRRRRDVASVAIWPWARQIRVDAILQVVEQRVKVDDVQIRGQARRLQHALEFHHVDLVDEIAGAESRLSVTGLLLVQRLPAGNVCAGLHNAGHKIGVVDGKDLLDDFISIPGGR